MVIFWDFDSRGHLRWWQHETIHNDQFAEARRYASWMMPIWF